MNRIESKIHCTHAHKKGKSKKKNGREKQMCVCIYLSLSFGRTRVQTVCCGNTKKSALILEREREKERGNWHQTKKKKKGSFSKSLKNPKHIGMEFRVCVVCLCFCCVENECVISCTYKTQHKRLCTTRARDDTRNNVSQQHRSGERKRGRRVLFLFVLVE